MEEKKQKKKKYFNLKKKKYPSINNTNQTKKKGKPGGAFTAQPGTPSVNGLTAALIAFNTNSAKPFRLDRSQAATCDQDHVYKDEHAAMNSGLMDKFVEKVGTGTLEKSGNTVCHATDVLGYFDGNTE